MNRKDTEDDLALLLDKPILTNWEVGQALRVIAGIMLDTQELMEKLMDKETNVQQG